MGDRSDSNQSPTWAKRWLVAAGIYNLVWGGVVIAFPHLLFDAVGIERLNYPQIWQCVGMIVGVYGIGYLAAARDTRRHWPIVLVGLLGKILGPIGFAKALWDGTFPPAFGLTILTNDLVWWIPFSLMLWDAARHLVVPGQEGTPSLNEALAGLRDQRGRVLSEITDERPTLVVLLRHSGCTFCRQALADLQANSERFKSMNRHLIVVTLGSKKDNATLAEKYGLESASFVSDPDRVMYRALNIPRGSFGQLFSPAVFVAGIKAFREGHGIGAIGGDTLQMPGTFLVYQGQVLRSHTYKDASDRPEYTALACDLPQT